MTVPPSPMRHRQPSDDGMTRVELTWIEKRIEHWIRFGRVAVDECYGFFPPRSMGASGPEDLRKVKLREHLAILAQVKG